MSDCRKQPRSVPPPPYAICCICLESVVSRPGQCVNCKGVMHYSCASGCATCPLCRFNSRPYGAIVTLQAVFRGALVRKGVRSRDRHLDDHLADDLDGESHPEAAPRLARVAVMHHDVRVDGVQEGHRDRVRQLA
jgi:hypothetical protein